MEKLRKFVEKLAIHILFLLAIVTFFWMLFSLAATMFGA